MIEIKAPEYLEIPWRKDGTVIPSVFLAGSIEMGKAVEWQKVVTEQLKDLDIVIYNPRRDDWDVSWKQSINEPEFREQVEWELTQLNAASHIFMYFAPETQSHISLLEYGLFAGQDKMIVCCPEGFWRKGNIEVTSSYYATGHNLYSDLDEAIDRLKCDILGNQ